MNVYLFHTIGDELLTNSPRDVALLGSRLNVVELSFLPIEHHHCYCICVSEEPASTIVKGMASHGFSVEESWTNSEACRAIWTLIAGIPFANNINAFVTGNVEHYVLRHVEAGACGAITLKLIQTGKTLATSLLSPAILAKHPVSDQELFEAYVRMIFETSEQCDATVFTDSHETHSLYNQVSFHSVDIRNTQAEAIGKEEIRQTLKTADIVVFEGSGQEYFTKKELQEILKQRTKSPLLVCDFTTATPLAVLRRLAHVYLFTNDNRKSLRSRSLKERNSLVGDAEGALQAATDRFNKWLEGKQRAELCGMLGAHPAIQSVFDLIRRVSKNDITVLVDGESGTGKELAAQAIHELSARKDAPFVVVNCGAIPENLIESELFGYVKGAFTGAHQDTPGLFRAADKGTIFLDEVGELPQSLQVKLLRVLQEREVRPVGESRSIPVDVRVVAATNKNLQKEVDEQRFRGDLFYRLNVVNITLPALKDRATDIPLLVHSFLAQASSAFGLQTVPNITPQALSLLQAYSWPGNIRQLRHTVERMVAVSETGIIDTHNIPQDILDRTETQQIRTPQTGEETNSIEKTLKHVERRHILKVLEEVDNNHEVAARVLGIGRTTLWRKLKEYGEEV